MKKLFNIRTLVEIGVFAAIGYVLDFFASCYSHAIFINGGSIGIAYICVVILAYRRGFVPALVCGFIMGLLDLVDGFYAVGDTFLKVFGQVCLDYVLAYPVCSVAGLFYRSISKSTSDKKRVIFAVSGAIVAGLFKYVIHVSSGFIFWMTGDYLWGIKNGVVYVLIYNFAYIGPSILLVSILIGLIAYKWPVIISDQFAIKNMEEKGV